MASPSPRWLKAAETHADLLVENFDVDLRGIARSIARHQNAEAVLQIHVGEAFDCLARAGLKRLTGWRRPEFEVGVGSFIFGLALASPDVLARIIHGEPRKTQRGFTSFSRNQKEQEEVGKKMVGKKMMRRVATLRLHLLTNHLPAIFLLLPLVAAERSEAAPCFSW